ncbi:MAG: pilus assembly protein [Nitrosospira sp.]|nr:pilus assembly protein [Nitrosospira sp.]MDN5936916.1 pilus assembly protein [Nitrosospira sp.]
MMNVRQFDTASRPANRRKQHGAAAVEFALVVSLLFTLLLGIMEMSRVLFYWNTATEATRLGARLAVVCNKDATVIKTRMNDMLGILPAGNIDVAYTPGGCDIDSCRSVTVSISGLNVSTFIPFMPLDLAMPSFSTTLSRESMDSANPDCS